MAEVAGHTYVFGVCACGRRRADVNSAAREALANHRTLIDEEGIAHVGKVNGNEWDQIVRDLQAQDKAFECI